MTNNKTILAIVIFNLVSILPSIQSIIEKGNSSISIIIYIVGFVMAVCFVVIRTRFDQNWIYIISGSAICSVVIMIGRYNIQVSFDNVRFIAYFVFSTLFYAFIKHRISGKAI